MLTRLTILFSICFATAAQVAAGPSEDRATNPRTVYFTVGDYQDALYTPLDSAAGIHAAFEVLHDKYGVRKIGLEGKIQADQPINVMDTGGEQDAGEHQRCNAGNLEVSAQALDGGTPPRKQRALGCRVRAAKSRARL